MRIAAFAALLALAGTASAEQPLEVRRQDLQVRVHVGGTVVSRDVVRLKSTIDGRVEDILVSTDSWASGGAPLGHLANEEMAAILDNHGSTSKGAVEDRWKSVYAPTPIECPRDCFVLRRFVEPRDWIKPRALLFEAALSLQLVGRVRPEDVPWVRDGQTLEFWSADDPSVKHKARVTHYVIDVQGEKVDPGATFTIELRPDNYLPPGTEWEGEIVPLTKRNVVAVPTSALIEYNGAVYLPVRVSTGITTADYTEITSGVQDRRGILVIDDRKLKDAQRYKQGIDYDAISRRIQEQALQSQPQSRRERRQQDVLPDPDQTFEDDPYSQ